MTTAAHKGGWFNVVLDLDQGPVKGSFHVGKNGGICEDNGDFHAAEALRFFLGFDWT